MNQPIDIVLNVYFLGQPEQPGYQQAQMLANCGLGLYHSAIEIQGVEYSYGGNIANSGSGVFTSAPMTVPNATYVQSYNMGTFTDSKHIYETLNTVREQFKANEYSLIRQNCNHFAEAFLIACCNKRLPSFVNRLARLGTWVDFLLPQSVKSLNPIASEGGSGSMAGEKTGEKQRGAFQGKAYSLQ